MVEPPKKVIKALSDYKASSYIELSFSKGDFFFVTDRENDSSFYHVSNPAKGIRGYVPVDLFEILETRAMKINKHKSHSSFSQPIAPSGESFINLSQASNNNFKPSLVSSAFISPSPSPVTPCPDSENRINTILNTRDPNSSSNNLNTAKLNKNKYKLSLKPFFDLDNMFKTGLHNDPSKNKLSSQLSNFSNEPVYAIVTSDFFATNKDELFVTKNEKLRILAQNSNNWFLAEILSKPLFSGLVPANHVALIEPDTLSLSHNASSFFAKYKYKIPTIDEWKYSTKNKTLINFESSHKNILATPPYSDTNVDSSDSTLFSQGYNYINCDSLSTASEFAERNDSYSPTLPQNLSNVTKRSTDPKLNPSIFSNQVCLKYPSIYKISVTSFIWKDGNFLFTTNYTLSNKTCAQVHKSWEQYSSFFQSVLSTFSNQNNSDFNHFNNQTVFMNNSIASKRLSILNDFITSSCKKFPEFLSSEILFDFLDIPHLYNHVSDKFSNFSSSFNQPLAAMKKSYSNSTFDGNRSSDKGKSSSSLQTLASSASLMPVKVKVVYKNDIVAFKLPHACSFNTLLDRIQSKLYHVNYTSKKFKMYAKLSYENIENTKNYHITNDSDLFYVINSSPTDKILITILD
ncbi:hypothetical protein BB561_003539 [Smittium simulii]|uniref:SH3 domain-containing protein n=1 Tax=Smittium simulii TaxID=133385 RepID=A0A2T9YKS3_9FUNG|nr:hypothetical protein BB561_003539 [Smittium simulii]